MQHGEVGGYLGSDRSEVLVRPAPPHQVLRLTCAQTEQGYWQVIGRTLAGAVVWRHTLLAPIDVGFMEHTAEVELKAKQMLIRNQSVRFVTMGKIRILW